jgi:phenylacetate-CoA ligase
MDLSLFAERERWSRTEILDYQRKRLNDPVRFAVESSPYYRAVIGNLPPGDVTLANLPTLTKRTLMSQWDHIVTDPQLRLADAERHISGPNAGEPLHGKYQVVASGGTTGVQGVAVYDAAAWETAMAAFQRSMLLQEISPTARVIGIGSPSPVHMSRRLFASIQKGRRTVPPRLSVTTPLPEIVAILNAFQPEVVLTYPSFIRRLAEEQQAGRLRIWPEKFCSTAETLTPDVREIARARWNALVLNAYGATEVNLIAAECPRLCGAHVPEDLIVLEVVDERNRPVPPGMLGYKILVTALYNRVFPMIRYEFSDLVSVASGPCPCGRTHLRLGSIQGRREDLLRLPARDGGHISVHAVHLHALLVRVPAIRQFELAPGPEHLHVRVSLRHTDGANGVDEVLRGAGRAIEDELDRLGADTRVTVEPVDDIARSGNGAKQKLVRTSA